MRSTWDRLRAWVLDKPGAADLSRLAPVVAQARALTGGFARMSDGGLLARLAGLPDGFIDSDECLAVFLASACELADRRVGLRPFLCAAAGGSGDAPGHLG